MAKRQKYTTSWFYHKAEDYRQRILEEEFILQQNVTREFYEELAKMIEAGELINMNINAPPTMGKSTTGCAIGYKITRDHPKYLKKPFDITSIARDDQEASKLMRDPSLKHCIILIDEWNSLEKTGENSSVEQALYDYFSDVMAQRMVHKISCSPKEQTDKNALIFLEVMSVDKINKINHCKLYYKILAGQQEYLQLIGVVSIPVAEVLKQDWYQLYRQRKFDKMNMLLEHGIFRPRVLDYAHIIRECTEKLRVLSKQPQLVTSDIVRNFVKQYCRKHKIPQSIVGEELATREVLGILNAWKGRWRVTKELKRIAHQLATAKNQALIEELLLQEKEQQELLTAIDEAIGSQEDELALYETLHKAYNSLEKKQTNV